jgi:hypothetical protein
MEIGESAGKIQIASGEYNVGRAKNDIAVNH